MTNYLERDLWLPTLEILAREPSGLTTTPLRHELERVLRPSGPDLAPYRGRTDSVFSQRVRNLLRPREALRAKGWITAGGSATPFRITPAGSALLQEALPTEAALVSQGVTPELVALERADGYENVIVEEGSEVTRTMLMRRRSRRLRTAAVAERRARTGSLACEACTFDFEAAYGALGRDYIEMHHRVPLHTVDATAVGITAALDDGRLIPLCANCHRMIHRLPGPVPSLPALKAAIVSTAALP